MTSTIQLTERYFFVDEDKTLTSYSTRIEIPERIRTKIGEILNQTLVDTLDLKTQFKQAQWNVKGMNFYQLYQLFEEIATKLEVYIDLVAQRATALGLVAVGTVRNAAQKSRIPEYSLKVSDGRDHLTELADRLALYAKLVRTAIAQTSDLGDRDTSDIYTEISRTADKYLWFIEAHLQKHCLFEG